MNSDKKLDILAKKLFDYYIKTSPTSASYMGIHKYDHLLPDRSKASIMRDIKKYSEFLQQFEKIDQTGLSFDKRIDRLLAIHTMRLWLFDYTKTRSWESDADAVDALGSSLFVLFSRDFAPFETRLKSMISRIEKSPKLFDQYKKRVTKPIKIWTNLAIQSCESFPEFLKEIVEASKKQTKNKKLIQRLEKAVEKCNKSVNDYKKFLETKLLPKSDEKFYIGEDLFRELIRLRELDMTPEKILDFGKASLRKEQQKMDEIARKINPKLSTKEVLEQVQMDHHKDFKLILKEYTDTCNELKEFVKKVNYATIPKNEKLIVVETPSFLRHTIPFAAYFSPARFDKEQLGIYIVTPPTRDEDFKKYSHADIRNVCVHEGYPGHHLQLSAANSNPSLIRVLTHATEFVEGWAFYCEDTAVEMGYDTTLEGELIKCYGMVWRAARIVVDVLLSTGKMSYDEAVEFMVREVGMIRSGAVAEVNRYTQSPSYQLSYYLGKHLLKQLKEDMKKKLGDKFDVKKFHDILIYNGSFPIKYHRMVLEEKM